MLCDSDGFTISVHDTTSKYEWGPETIHWAIKKTPSIYKHIAHLLGIFKREFDKRVDESTAENFKEIHKVIDMDKGRVLDFQCSKHVTYADVANPRDCFTVRMRILRVPQGKVEKPFVIFQNPSSNYSIAWIQDNVEGITYSPSPKNWTYSHLFHKCFSNEQVIAPVDEGSTRKLWIDSCGGYNNTPELLESLQNCRTEIRRFHPNCTGGWSKFWRVRYYSD